MPEEKNINLLFKCTFLKILSRYSGRASERKKRQGEEDTQEGDQDEEKDGDVGDEDDDEVIEVESSNEEEEEEEEEDDDEEEEGAAEGDAKEEEALKEPVEIEEGEVEGGDEEGKEKEADDGAGEGEEKETKEKEVKESSKEGGSSSPKKEIKKKKKVVTKKSLKKGKSSATEAKEAKKTNVKEESGSDDKEGEKKATLTNFLGQPYIKLKCPHCHFACVTFKEYSRHLGNTKHLAAMSTLSAKLRKTFATMRLEQRKMQKVLDEEAKSLNMRLRTVFCNVCKLNYRTLKSQHQNSASHKKMREFQSPYCRVCRVGFKSSWAYEVHLCELQHIKRKARIERLSNPPGAKDVDDDINLDTNNFMVLDAVGSGDDSEGEKSDIEVAEEKTHDDSKEKIKEGNKDKKKKEKKEIKLGSEFCKLMEVYFCELCKIYLPRLDDKERALTVHCRSRTHLQRYIRSRDDRNLRRKAVKLHKEREKLREKEKEKKSASKEDSTIKEEREETSADNKVIEGGEDKSLSEVDKKKGDTEDKSWSEVDKDLSCLLNEEEEEEAAEKHSEDDDDDEESKEGERYDRFKHSEKELGVNNGGKTDKNEEVLPDSPAPDKQPVKGKTGTTTKDTAATSCETGNTANGNITTAEKKKIEAAE